MIEEYQHGWMPTNVGGRAHLWFGVIDEDDEPSETAWVQSSLWMDVLAAR